MLKFKHYTVAVQDLESSVQNYKDRFGMEALTEPTHNAIGNFDAVSMGFGGETVLQLIRVSGEDSPLARLMKDRKNDLNPYGEGVYLMAFDSDDPEALAEQIESNGGRITRLPRGRNYFVHPTSSNFVLMEIFPASDEGAE